MSIQEHTQYPNDMSDTSKAMKSQNTPQTPCSPYLYSPYLSPPLATKHQKEGEATPGVEKTESTGWVRR